LRRLSVLCVAAVTGAALLLSGGASAQSSNLPTVQITSTGTAISVSGSLQSGAVNVSMTTTSKTAEPTLVRLNPGVTEAQLLAAAPKLADPNDITPYGSIVFESTAPRGTTTVQTVLAAGNYVALDTQGPNPAKAPHSGFTIAQAAQPASLPASKAKLRAIDFGFKSPRTLRAGTTVRLRNDGFVVHMIAGIGVKNAKAAKRIIALLKAGKDRKAQKLSTGFVNLLPPVSHGSVQQMTLKAKPGVYVLACFMTTQDGRPHTRLGMLRTIRIKG
jgi:hypothetical protein